MFFVLQLAIPILVVPMQARALFGIGDVSITVGDIPRTIYEILSKTLKTAADVGFKNILRTYLNNLAYNVAVQIATGEKGQKPLFVTKPEELLKQAGDAAAGDFLDSIASDWLGKTECSGYTGSKCKADSSCPESYLLCPDSLEVTGCTSSIEEKNKCIAAGCRLITCSTEDCPEVDAIVDSDLSNDYHFEYGAPECASNFSLCDLPGPGGPNDRSIQIKLNVLARKALTDQGGASISGRCPLTDIIDKYDEYRTAIDNYEGLLGKTNPNKQYLVEFSKTFNPEATQLGAYLDILNKGKAASDAEVEINKFAQSLAGEFKPVKSKISGAVKTPAGLLSNAATSIFGKSIDPYLTYTGTAIADAVGIFTNTLASKLIQRYIFGVDPATSSGSGGRSGIASFLGGSSPGVTAAKFLFADLQNTNYSVAGTTDILGNLSSCPDPNNPTPTNCVIDTRFRTAIEQELTLRQALEQGLIDGSKPFGFDSNGLEPEYYNGYPYRSLLILRKYRIIPVGWELAAQYGKQFASGNYSLNTLIADYDDIESPFYKLVDPNWVLKSPEVFCRRQGAGEQIIANTPIRNEDTNGDGRIDTKDAATAVVQRQGDYCADEQLCLQENADGSCARYGYCVEDKPVWKFSGTQCDAQFASCQSLTKSDGTVVSYLLNTVETNGCNADNAGCQWYCSSYNNTTRTFECNGKPPGATGSGAKLSFNNDIRQCDSSAAGCTEYIPRLGSGANVLTNTDFETYDRTAAGIYDALKDSPVADHFQGWVSGQDLSGTPNCGLSTLAVSDAYEGFTAIRLATHAADCPGFPASGTGTFTDGGRMLWNVNQPAGLLMGERVEGRSYSLSFYAKTAADDTDCTGSNGKATLYYLPFGSGVGTEANFGTVTATDGWTRYSGTFTVPEVASDEYNAIALSIHRDQTDQCDIIVDNIQFEEGNLTAYKSYDQNPKTFLKQADSCSMLELGCQAYTSVNNGRTVTGVISSPGLCDPNVPGSCDQCPAEFVGCSAFRELAIERPPYRALRDPVSFVPDSGQSCPASAVGCEEYTNLETVAQGGEGKEYYSYIRMCVPSDDPQQRTYYTWEGSNEFGFQLREYSLKKSNQNDGPCTNMGAEGDPIIQAQLGSTWPTCIDGGSVDRDGNGTDEEFYNPATCSPDQVGVNPDCTEYYDTAGVTYYLLRSRVIFASEDCKNFRNSNDGPNMVYHMVPGQGISCQAAYAGCRAYKGNAGDNSRDLYVKDFEDGSIGAWTGNASISTEATSAGGHSMLVSNSAAINNAGDTLGFAAGNQYTITFWARSAIAGTTNVSFALNTTPSLSFTGQASAGELWNRFTVGPVFVPVGADPANAQLVLFSNNAFYIDNIVISEVVENIYKVKGSYKECSGYEGCDEYSDRDGNQHFLKSFSRLCGEDKVGCTAMIATQQSTSPYSSTFTRERYLRGDVNYDGRLSADDVTLMNEHFSGADNYFLNVSPAVGDVNIDGAINIADAVALLNHINNGTSPAEPYYFEEGTTPEDETVYIVDDPEKVCGANQAGCTQLGKPGLDGDGNVTAFTDTYLVVDPDRFGQEMCVFAENQCDAFTSANGSQYYFKDPGQKLCEFKRVSGQDISGWYKLGTDQGAPNCPVSIGICSGGGANDGKICNASSDCDSNFCNRNQNIVPQPVDGWVGACSSGASGCTEYRDPEQVQTGGEIVSRNYSENGGFETFTTTANASIATDGVIDTALPDVFTPWASSQTSAGRCTGDANRTCNTNVNCSAHGAGVCDTSQRVACGLRMHADSQSNTGNVAARVKTYDACGKSVNSSITYHCAINSATTCTSDADCGASDYCLGDQARYIWYGVNTDSITDNRAFKVSFQARLDPNDATCDPSNSGNTDIGFGLVRTIDNRAWPNGRTDYRPYSNFNATNSWTTFENVVTFGSVDPDDWYNTSGSVEELQNNFSMVIRRSVPAGSFSPSPNTCDILIDSFSIVEVADVFDYVPYYYIDETVDQASCNGLVDREEGCRLFNDTSNSELPYVSTLSVDGETPALCADPNECDSNAVIKVIRDRECKRWLECETSVRQEDAEGNVEELCLSRYVCEELDPETGQCTKVGEFESVNQTYDSPAFVSKIQNYTGLVMAGLDWDRRCTNNPSITCTSDAQCGSGTCDDPQIYEGSLPVAAMEEVGSISINGEIIEDGDFGDRDYALNQKLSCPLSASSDTCVETPGLFNATEIALVNLDTAWQPRNLQGGTAVVTWAEEDINNGTIPSTSGNLDENNVARVKTSGNVGAGTANWNGIYYDLHKSAQRSEEYYVSFRLRWGVPASAYDTVRVQFAYVNANGNELDYKTVGDFAPTVNWKEYVYGPIRIGDTNSGAPVDFDSIRLEIVHNFQSGDTVPSVEFYLDDVSMKPVLQTKESDQGLLSRDCRLFPGVDSPYCTYTDENNTTHKGWEGYCLEHDPRYPKYCLNWWPVDLLKGDSSAFSSLKITGYSGRRPLYMCLGAEGNYSTPKDIRGANQTTFSGATVNSDSAGTTRGNCGISFPISPLLNLSYRYRGPMSTIIVNQSGTGECDEAGNMAGTVPASNCQFKTGVCGACDAGDGGTCNAINSTYNAAVGDQYYKWEVRDINFVMQRWAHTDWDCNTTATDEGRSIFILNARNNWDATWSCSGNSIRVRVNWAANNRLQSYTVTMTDGNNGGGAWVQGIFRLNEMCTSIASVVTWDDDKAWFERTNTNSPYLLPDLLYRYHQHTTPYGGIIQPSPAISTPSAWRWDNGVGSGPIYIENKSDDTLAHGGSSYSCPSGGCAGRMCSWNLDNDCSTQSLQRACLEGPDPDDSSDDGYCLGLGEGFCSNNAEIYCRVNSDCLSGVNDFGPCLLGGGGASPITTIPQGNDRLRRLFARPFLAWRWDNATAGYVEDTTNLVGATNLPATWIGQYANMSVCPYSAPKGAAERPLYPNDYCGVPPVIDTVLCGAGGQPSTSGCQNVSVGQLVQLTFNVNADPNQKPVKLIEVDFDNDGNADYSSVGTYDSGTVFVTHEYTTGGAYPIRIRVIDNWDWCGVLKGTGSSCPSGDCRYQVDGSPCANQGWFATGVTANVNP